jgi:hypothetical protein
MLLQAHLPLAGVACMGVLCPPSFLAGDAARVWALTQGLSASPDAQAAGQVRDINASTRRGVEPS